MTLQGSTMQDILNPQKKLNKLQERINHIDATVVELKDKRKIMVYEIEQILDGINGVTK